MSHTRETTERLAAGLPGAELVEPPWGDAEWNERSAEYAANGTTGLFVRWPLLVPHLTTWAEKKIEARASPTCQWLTDGRCRQSAMDNINRMCIAAQRRKGVAADVMTKELDVCDLGGRQQVELEVRDGDLSGRPDLLGRPPGD